MKMEMEVKPYDLIDFYNEVAKNSAVQIPVRQTITAQRLTYQAKFSRASMTITSQSTPT